MSHIHPTTRQAAGFTLIELVMVIVILGILAAVAVPKFTDLSSEAEEQTAKNIAGAITSADKTNQALKPLSKHTAIAGADTCKAAAEKLATVDWGTLTAPTTTVSAGACEIKDSQNASFSPAVTFSVTAT